MKRFALLVLLAGCGAQPASPPADTPGARLEAAAQAAGLIADPARASIVGSWGRDTDRLCVVPDGDTTRIGALLDYGEGQGCAASGTVRRSGESLTIAFGPCRFKAKFDGERIVFPAEIPAACDRMCDGRASFAALTVDRLSGSASEPRRCDATRPPPVRRLTLT